MAVQIQLGGGNILTVKAGAEDTAGAYALIEYYCMPGSGSGAHVHTQEAECLYLISGALTVQFEDAASFEVVAGESVQIARGQRHSFINRGAEPARVLIIAVPAGLDSYFIELGELLVQQASEQDFERLNEKYGLTFFA